MSDNVTLKVELKIGPATIAYESPEDAQLFYTSASDFIQMVMDLMNYIGTEDDPPELIEEPVPVVFPQTTPPYPNPSYPGIFYNQSPMENISGSMEGQSSTVSGVPDEVDTSVVDGQWEEFAKTEAGRFFDAEDTGGTPGATIVGRIGPVQEKKLS